MCSGSLMRPGYILWAYALVPKNSSAAALTARKFSAYLRFKTIGSLADFFHNTVRREIIQYALKLSGTAMQFKGSFFYALQDPIVTFVTDEVKNPFLQG